VKNDRRTRIRGIKRRGFVPLDKSQSKHPKPPPRPQIPVDADWTSSSAIFTVCRRIDLYRCVDVPFHLKCVRGSRVRTTDYHLRLCLHINRDNRGSPEAAYRARGPPGMAAGVHGGCVVLAPRREFRSRARTLHANGRRLLWENSAVWICEVGNETKRKERINGRRTQRRWDEKRPVRGKTEIATEVSGTDAGLRDLAAEREARGRKIDFQSAATEYARWVSLYSFITRV